MSPREGKKLSAASRFSDFFPWLLIHGDNLLHFNSFSFNIDYPIFFVHKASVKSRKQSVNASNIYKSCNGFLVDIN